MGARRSDDFKHRRTATPLDRRTDEVRVSESKEAKQNALLRMPHNQSEGQTSPASWFPHALNRHFHHPPGSSRFRQTGKQSPIAYTDWGWCPLKGKWAIHAPQRVSRCSGPQ